MNLWKKLSSELGDGQKKDDSKAAPAQSKDTGKGADKPQDRPVSPPQPSAKEQEGQLSKGLEDKLLERFSKTRSALGSGTVIQGKLSFDSVVRIDGKLSGEVFSSKALIIGPAGQIDADIQVASLVVLGKVKGKVRANERVEVWQGGQLEADITTPVLVIEEGAMFSGGCAMKR